MFQSRRYQHIGAGGTHSPHAPPQACNIHNGVLRFISAKQLLQNKFFDLSTLFVRGKDKRGNGKRDNNQWNT